jgi:hypothetical protein
MPLLQSRLNPWCLPANDTQASVSAGRLAWIVRLPAPALSWPANLLVRVPGDVLACSGDGSPFR